MVDNSLEANTRYKVGRVLVEYELDDFHDRLPSLWLGDVAGEEPMSLRDLAEKINITLLRRTLEEAGDSPLEGEAENAYRLLTDESVSAGVQAQQRNRLERAGVDVDKLESDFVTHQAVYSYLTNGLGITKETQDETDPVQKHEDRINRLRSRTTAVIENSLAELESAEKLSVNSPDVIVDLQVYCDKCGTQYELGELLAAGGCNCP